MRGRVKLTLGAGRAELVIDVTLLRSHNGKVGKAAESVGIDRGYLWRLLRRHAIQNPGR